MAVPSLLKLTVAPNPRLDDEVNEIRLHTADIVSDHIIPNEETLGLPADDPKRQQFVTEIKAFVKEAGLWAPHLPKEYGGMGVGFIAHAYMNEILAWSPYSNSLFGVVAPNSGNQTLLLKLGTEEQKKQWLEPLIAGEMQSCFSMTEPDNAGSDPRSIQTRAVKDGDHWVINGRKWFTSNAVNADFAIVMCRTEEDDGRGSVNEKMTQIIVPTDTPGFEIERSVPVWGHTGGHHCEIVYRDVRVPLANALGRQGTGHAAAQERLGDGRIFHCMNCVGQMWRAFDLMVKRATERQVHGGLLEDKQFIQGFIADSYIDIQASRLMTIRTAEIMEQGGDARTDISAIKVFVPNALARVVDRAIQVHGAMGVSGDTPLAGMFLGARTLRLADGPDEVHRILIAKNVLRAYHSGHAWDFGV
ncbi:MAG: acyl-CoA dehydrogenase family protein [Gammaproteobacteria bacterium]|nr:acyl-CoA dehydrogenase family protein [Gammaproteobacteria bacterium]